MLTSNGSSIMYSFCPSVASHGIGDLVDEKVALCMVRCMGVCVYHCFFPPPPHSHHHITQPCTQNMSTNVFCFKNWKLSNYLLLNHSAFLVLVLS